MTGVIPGYTQAGNTITPEWFGASGDGTTDDYSALSAAIAFLDAQSGGTLLLTPGKTYSIETGLTVAGGTTLGSIGDGKIKPANGITLTINGNIECGKEQLFDASASGLFSFGRAQILKPEWWGTCSSSNNTIQHAIDASCRGCEIRLSQIYETGPVLINDGDEGISIIGEGGLNPPGGGTSAGAVIKLEDGQTNQTLFKIDGTSISAMDVYLHNFKLHGNKAGQVSAYDGMQIVDCKHVYIGHLIIEEAYRHGLSCATEADLVFIDYVEVYNCGSGGTGHGMNMYQAHDWFIDRAVVKDSADRSWSNGWRCWTNHLTASGGDTGIFLGKNAADYTSFGSVVVGASAANGLDIGSLGNYIGSVITYNHASSGVYFRSTAAKAYVGRVIAYDDQGTPTQIRGVMVGKAEEDLYSEANQDGGTVLRAGATTSAGQSFEGAGKVPRRVKFYLKRTLNPTGNATAKVYAHTGTFGSSGTPTGAALATSEGVDVSGIGVAYELTEFIFPRDEYCTLTDGTNYFVTVEYSGGDAANYITVGYDGSSPSHDGNYATYNGAWAADANKDCCFRLYMYGENVIGAFSHDGNMTTAAIGLEADSVDYSDQIWQPKFQSVAFAASITPEPWLGETIQIGDLTNNLSIGNISATEELAGMEMTFILEQDGVGGRTVSWGGDYSTTWSDANNNADAVSSISFVFNGTEWRETAYSSWHQKA